MKEKMRSMLTAIKEWWVNKSKTTKTLLIVGGSIVALVLLVGKKDTGNVVEIVKKQTITRTVIASGKVVSSTDLSLGFEVSDVVRSVNVSVGQTVSKGAIIATLNSGEERAAATSAKGALLSAEARYKKVLDGSSNEEIALAQVNLDSAKKELVITKKTQETLVENARRKLLSDNLVAEPVSTAYIAGSPRISGTYIGAEGQYTISYNGGNFLEFYGVESGKARFSTTTSEPFGTKGLSIVFPAGTTSIPTGEWMVSLPNTASSAYVSNLNAYNQALDTKESAISSAESLVAQREAELNLKRATARQPDVDSALAEVITAQAGVESANARLEKKILRAPADGTITKVDIKVGEISTPQKEIIVLQDVANLYLEANIGEGNISTIALGQSVTVSYDALPGESSIASVSSIDPSATENGTVINYKIKALISDSEGIRPGMTANMSIVTAEIPDILVLPGRVVLSDDEGQFVEVIIDPESKKQKTVRTPVTTGVKGDGDIVQITTGVSEGQHVLWTPNTK